MRSSRRTATARAGRDRAHARIHRLPKTIARDWAKLPNASAEVVPNVHPARYPATYPKALAGRAGWHQVDLACPIGPHTWDAALAASEVATTAADLVLAGERQAYALCRPPGHHAYADMAGGFCFLNNTAIAAQRLRASTKRVAVLDVDVHHGNGTQGIFFDRDDVLTVSIHADPATTIPTSGATPTRPARARAKATISTCRCRWARPTRRGSSRRQGAGAHPRLRADRPGRGAGSRRQRKRSAAGPEGHGRRLPRHGTRSRGLGLPTVLVQEGGYLSDDLGRNLVQFLAGFETGRERTNRVNLDVRSTAENGQRALAIVRLWQRRMV